jgi:hypothetical protein
MRIITASIPGTGDLWLFNATRLICESFGTVYGVIDKHYYSHEAKDYNFQVIKAQNYNADIVASSVVIATTCSPSGLDVEDPVYAYYNQSLWNAQANGVIEYETIKTDPKRAIREISYALSLHVNDYEILNELEQIKAPEKGFDNRTLLAKNMTL